MTVDLTLKNCKIWYKDRLINFGLALDEGKIVSISKDTGLPTSDEKIDCKGNIVLPGLIDDRLKNLKTAKDLGMKTIYFKREDDSFTFHPNFTIKTLAELQKILLKPAKPINRRETQSY